MTSTVASKTVERLTSVERDSWDSAGYIVVPGALSPDEANEMHATVMERARSAGAPTGPVYSEHRLWRAGQLFRDVVDSPRTIGRVIDLIGEDIQLMSAEYIIRFRHRTESLWHVDGADTSDGVGGFPKGIKAGSLLQVKVGIALHDLVTPDSGVTRVVPGSHLLENSRVGRYKGTGEEPPGAVSVRLAKGDAMIFHQSIWHTGGLVERDEPRVMLFYGYNYLFCRPFDYDIVPTEELDACNDVQRRLLAPFEGAGDRPSRFFGRPSKSLCQLLGMDGN